MKYIVVTGGVVSGLGKGVTISSMGRLLQACGLSVTALKIDPYLNETNISPLYIRLGHGPDAFPARTPERKRCRQLRC